MTVIPISGDHLIAFNGCHLHADDHGLLTDVEMTKPTNEPHAIHLTRLFFEAADGEHHFVGFQIFIAGECWNFGLFSGGSLSIY